MRQVAFPMMLLVACAALAGCSHEVNRKQVAEFIDQADDAARKRFAPEICALRGKNFTMHVIFYGAEGRDPSQLDMSRKLYCQQAGSFSRLRQYKLERKSMVIDISTDRRTATVTAQYAETMPYYEPDMQPATPDDFRYFQVLESHDESVVGLEGGDVKFLSARVEAHQSLVPKGDLQLPYD
jgi:Tfp pilus assembly protein PilP